MTETIIAAIIGAAISLITTLLTLLVNASIEKIRCKQRGNKEKKRLRGRKWLIYRKCFWYN